MWALNPDIRKLHLKLHQNFLTNDADSTSNSYVQSEDSEYHDNTTPKNYFSGNESDLNQLSTTKPTGNLNFDWSEEPFSGFSPE